MGLISYINNLHYLLKRRGSVEITSHSDADKMIRASLIVAKANNWKKRGVLRNLLAERIRNIHSVYKYQPIDYSEAKKMYEEYFTLENHIPSYSKLIHRARKARIKNPAYQEDLFM